jgi:hypothetical protein
VLAEAAMLDGALSRIFWAASLIPAATWSLLFTPDPSLMAPSEVNAAQNAATSPVLVALLVVVLPPEEAVVVVLANTEDATDDAVAVASFLVDEEHPTAISGKVARVRTAIRFSMMRTRSPD